MTYLTLGQLRMTVVDLMAKIDSNLNTFGGLSFSNLNTLPEREQRQYLKQAF